MHIRTIILALCWPLFLAVPALAQFQDGEPGGVKIGETATTKWRCGMTITASGGPCRGIVGYVPVPIEWPEQQVKIAEEDISDGVKISYQVVDKGVKLMVIKVASLEAGKEVHALVTYEIQRNVILPPEKTDIFQLADPAKLDADIRPFLTPSPKIESTEQRIRDVAKEIGTDKTKAWERVEAIYDWVREKVKYEENSTNKGAMQALKEGRGDCEGMSSLFIAICRANKIPARLVWIPGHCYPEFYLLDGQGTGHWFPCQAAGTRAFGAMPETKPILQKGDNFQPPYNPKERKRYLAEYLKGTPATRGGGEPRVVWVRELIP
jgi:hypothetical protein